MGYTSGWDTRRELINHLTEGWSYETTLEKMRSDSRHGDKQPPADMTEGNWRVEVKPLTFCYRGGVRAGVLYIVFQGTAVNSSNNQRFEAYRFIAVHAVSYYTPRRHEYGGGWGYKDMTESCGPCYYSCPLKYLDMVTDPGGYATEWRQKVREWHAARKNVYKPTLGETIELVDGITLNKTPIKTGKVIKQRPLIIETHAGRGRMRAIWVKGPAPVLADVSA